MTMDVDRFSREITALSRRMRDRTGRADLDHLRRIGVLGRACGLLGFVTAPFAPNPASVALLALGLMARFVVGHAVAHGAYDRIPDVPARCTRRRFARGWRRLLDWPDWWTTEDWVHTHNRIHHRHTQAPGDADVMDPAFLARRPLWLRVACLALLAISWKFAFYAPRLRKDRVGSGRRHGVSFRDLVDLRDPVTAGLWTRGYLPYVGIRFLLPALLAAPLGAWATGSMLLNLVAAELVHNVHAFLCIRPSHCGGDIPLFTASARTGPERQLQSVLGTVNYRPGGDLHDLLHGWQNYQVEHHLWPAATLLQCRRARSELVAICRTTGVPYVEDVLATRVARMCRLFLGLDRQPTVDTGQLASGTRSLACQPAYAHVEVHP